MLAGSNRQQHRDAAQDRLKFHVLTGVSIAGILLGGGGTLVTVLYPGIDPDIAMMFVPDALVGVVALAMLFGLRRPRAVTAMYTGFYLLNYAFFAVHAEGYQIFASTTFVLMPPVFGYYLGSRRLGVWISGIIVLEGMIALVVHHVGIGHQLIKIPPMDDPATRLIMALGTAWVLGLVTVFERARHRTQAQLDEALRQLDTQGDTLLTVVESQGDAVLLLDERHRVVLHNQAAAASLPSLAVGVDFRALLPADRIGSWDAAFTTSAKGGHARAEQPVPTAQGVRDYEISFSRVSSGDRLIGFTLVARDLTERRAAEGALRRMRGQLLDASRRAGRAEVAAALLHNLGNTLNGATVSASQIGDRARGLRLDGLRRAATLLREQAPALTSAMGEKAPKLLAFLDALSEELDRERGAMIAQAAELGDQIATFAGKVAEHEQHARVREVLEEVDLTEIVTSALAEDDSGREVTCSLDQDGMLLTVRHRLLDVVVALLGHARGIAAEQPVAVTLRGTASHLVLTLVDGAPHLDPPAILALTSHGGSLHDAALGAAQLGGTLRRPAEAWILELPRAAATGAAAAA